MIPSSVWPRYPCLENNGEGWDAEVVDENSKRVRFTFTNAKRSDGTPWGIHELTPEHVIELGEDGRPVPPETHALSCEAAMDQEVPLHLALHRLEGTNVAFEPDQSELLWDAMTLDNASRAVMLHLGVRSGTPRKAKPRKQQLCTIRGKPAWKELPHGALDAMNMPNAPGWVKAMQGFLDKTRAFDGFLPAAW